MKKNNRQGAMYAEPVEWVSLTGVILIGNVMINAKLYIGTVWGRLLQKKLLSFRDPLGFPKTVFIKTTHFEDDLVNYLFENQGKQTYQTIKHFNKEDPAKVFGVNKTTFISGKILHKNKYEDFALEILEEKAILFGQHVKVTGVPGIFYSKKFSELTTVNLKINIETFLSSIIDSFNFEIFEEREFFMKIRTLQCENQQLSIQTIIEISKNVVSPSVALFGQGTYVERAGSVLYVHKCAKMVAKIAKLTFCTEEVPELIQGQNCSSIRYLEPLTKFLYHNYTIAACIPNVVKLEDGSFQQYGETLKKIDHEIYQWPMNNDLNSSDKNLHLSLFFHIRL